MKLTKARSLFGILIGAVCIVLVCYSLIDFIPPRDMTATRMHGVRYRVQTYAVLHDKLPESIEGLPERPGYDSSHLDGWRRTIQYQTRPDGIVTLTSLGHDGMPGGSGDDADIIRSYRSRSPDGTWADVITDWSEDSLAHRP